MSTWRERLKAEGTTPDPRMTLANERTFLAWIRTALAMVAGGIGLEAFAGGTIPDGVRVPLSAILLLLGALLSGGSWLRWLDAERALRRGDDMPVSRLTPVITAGVMVVAVVLVVVVVVRG